MLLAIGYDKTLVSKVYQHFAVAVLPSALPSALHTLYLREPVASLPQEDWSNLAPDQGGSGTVESILANRRNVFPGLLEQLGKEREIKIQVIPIK